MTKLICDKCGGDGGGEIFNIALPRVIVLAAMPKPWLTKDLCGSCKRKLDALIEEFMKCGASEAEA